MLVKVARALSQIRDIISSESGESEEEEGQSSADIHTSFREMLSGKKIIGGNSQTRYRKWEGGKNGKY